MSKRWLGECYFSRSYDDKCERFKATVAVFCDSQELYQEIVERYLLQQGLHIEQFENIKLFEKLAVSKEGLLLTQAINDTHIVEMGSLQAVEDERKGEDSYLNVFELEGIKPLDLQIGIWPKQTVPTELKSWLFGEAGITQREAERYGDLEQLPEMKTYALIDAAKINNFPLMLEDTDLNYECLFKGKVSEELKEVAAYLVELTLEDSLTCGLFTESGLPDHLWNKDCAVFLRSRASLAELRHHFRKFLRLYSKESDSWKYFRFYAPETLRTLVTVFDKNQFEAFAKDVRMFACRSAEDRYIFISRKHEVYIEKPVMVETV